MNWRLLEAEIIDIARRHGLTIDEDTLGNKFVTDEKVDVTAFSQALAERVELKTKAVQVKL